MIDKNMSKVEIEKFLKGKGDFVQIDHLSRFLGTRDVPLDKKKFVYEKLAGLYEKKKMFSEAAKMFNNIAIVSLTFKDKIKSYVKEAELYIKAGLFVQADEAVKKAMGEANATERNEIFFEIKEFYKRQGEAYERDRKIGNAIKLYEKFLEMKISDSERAETKEKLMTLYEKSGRLREYFSLKKGE